MEILTQVCLLSGFDNESVVDPNPHGSASFGNLDPQPYPHPHQIKIRGTLLSSQRKHEMTCSQTFKNVFYSDKVVRIWRISSSAAFLLFTHSYLSCRSIWVGPASKLHFTSFATEMCRYLNSNLVLTLMRVLKPWY